MPISIRNPKTEALARKVARATGVSMTEAISRALEDTLKKIESVPTQSSEFAAIMNISLRCSELPTLDNSPEDDIFGYSDLGA